MNKIKIREGRILPLLNKKSFKSLSKYTGAKVEILDEQKTLLTKTTTILINGSEKEENKFLEILGELKNFVQYEIIKI